MNKMRLRILCTVLAGVLAAVPSLADTALVWSSGNPDGNTAGVAAYIAQYGCFSTVEAVDADFVPLSTLVNYDVVLYFSNHSGSQDPVAIGDVLADYADTGRHLVIATFSWANQGGNTLAGRVISDQISPLLPLGSSVYSSVTMSSHDGSGYFIAVNSVDGYYHDDVSLAAGAVLHASWSDGEPMLADKGNVVGIDLFPDDSFGLISGDYKKLFANAMCSPGATAVTATTWGSLKAHYR